ncbi:hypothetical protein ACIBTV_27340 [Micromonospora sp. NPDC049366]|uniref:hypothetical protein n=1 Tax=Micromonospora sp. NPDC049366 TaxID=3364271 RepID=UPI0037BD8453
MARTATRTARTATATAKAATPTLARTADGGVILTGLPFHIDGVGRTFLVMGGKGLGWTHDKAAGGWVSATPGAAAECLATWADKNVEIIDLTGRAPAKAATAKATGTRTATAKAASAPAKAATAKADATLAEIIRTALAKADVPADVVAEIIGHAETVASRTAKAATAKATGTRTAKAATAKTTGTRTAKAATAKATMRAKMDDDGARRFGLIAGIPVKAAAKAVRQAIAADVRNGGVCAGAAWHVMTDRAARAIMVHRVADDARPAGAEIDAIVAGAVATLA